MPTFLPNLRLLRPLSFSVYLTSPSMWPLWKMIWTLVKVAWIRPWKSTTVIVTAWFTVFVAHLSSWDQQNCHSILCTRYIHILVIGSLQFAWFLIFNIELLLPWIKYQCKNHVVHTIYISHERDNTSCKRLNITKYISYTRDNVLVQDLHMHYYHMFK